MNAACVIAMPTGDDRADADALFGTLYAELHRLARPHLVSSAGEIAFSKASRKKVSGSDPST
jgi:hypothetical protein